MDKAANITFTIPKGDMDTIESVESRPIEGFTGVYELLVNDKPGRLLIDLSQFENSEEAIRRLYTGVGEGFIKHHRRKNNGN